MEPLSEFLARHLNDHEETARGVRQPTFFTWSESHITSAVEMALAYLYSLIPEEFTEIKEFTTTEEDCLVSFCEECSKFMGVIDINVEGKGCIDLVEETEESETNSLLSMLSTTCTAEDEDQIPDEYKYQKVEGSNCAILFKDPIPVGTKIRYSCASPPDTDDLDDDELKEYLPIIGEYSAWWLFRTDSESRSNLERARLHFEGLRFLVETKLLLEFSLKEDDYHLGRRKIDD